jgi:hypothetical protein
MSGEKKTGAGERRVPPTNTFIGHLGRQDYDDTLAHWAEYTPFVHVQKNWLDRAWQWLVSLFQYRSN